MSTSLGQSKGKGHTPNGGGNPGTVKNPHMIHGNPPGK
jgi:hypothetical protein